MNGMTSTNSTNWCQKWDYSLSPKNIAEVMKLLRQRENLTAKIIQNAKDELNYLLFH